MSSDSNPTSDTHVYKFKPWLILLNVVMLAFCAIIIIGVIAYMAAMLVSVNRAGTDYRGFQYFFLCLLVPIIILFGLVILQIILGIIQTFKSSIKTTPEGIEHQVWPLRHLRARWSEVERLDKFLFYDALYLKSYELIGPSLSHTSFLKFFNLAPNVLALSSYNGWPNGQLAEDVKHYAPRLFEKQPAAEEPEAANLDSTASGTTQEQRTLAALSHAAVLFAGLGIFIPIVIYVTQKKKSAYLAFQTLQAIFYQLVGNIIGLIFPFCIAGAAIAFAFGTASSGNGNTQASFMLGGMILLIALTLLIAFVAVAFTVYGMVGAVLTYQGKDFRYAIIGKRVAKSSKV